MTGATASVVAVREGAVVVSFELPVEVTERTPRETPGETPGKTPAAVLHLLKEQPGLSIPELAVRLGKSESAIERAIRRLREAGQVERIGPAKGGSWQVSE